MSLLSDKIKQIKYNIALITRKGLEDLLDVVCLEESEFMIFARDKSLLSLRIQKRRRARTVEETIKATLEQAKQDWCPTCFKSLVSCKCGKPL